MATHPYTSFRRSAFAATAIAGLAVTSLFPSQASAQTAPTRTAYQGTAPCSKAAKDDSTLTRAMQCEVRELDRRIAAEKKRGVDADRRGAEADRRSAEADQRATRADQRAADADRVSACVDFLLGGVKQGLFTKGAVLVAAKGKLTAANACEAARGFGYNQKAELSHPSVH